MVYILYDQRGSDQPQWLKDDFENGHIATMESTDGN
jgi:hypothetical protein